MFGLDVRVALICNLTTFLWLNGKATLAEHYQLVNFFLWKYIITPHRKKVHKTVKVAQEEYPPT